MGIAAFILAGGLAAGAPLPPALPPPSPALTVTAKLVGTPEVGSEQAIALEIEWGAGWTNQVRGALDAVVQCDVPDSVTLSGRVLRELNDLKRNEFVEEPWERRVDPGHSEIRFTIGDRASRDAVLGINVVAYAAPEGTDDVRLFRRRIELPLTSGATGVSTTNSGESDWGHDDRLQIGDDAPGFDLARIDGTGNVTMKSFEGKWTIVSTYRAFW